MIENEENLPVSFGMASSDWHFEQILQLQKQNHYTSVSAEKQVNEGFVFAEHTLALLKVMAANAPQIIALCGSQLAGYNLSMTKSMGEVLPSLIPMFREFEKWDYRGKPLMDYQFIVGGQVCVHQDFRGRGMIRSLYEQTRDNAGTGYELCVTEISTRNVLSLKAHQRLGFEVLGMYNDGVEDWNLIVWEF